MKLWGKRNKIEYSDQAHNLDSPGFWVNWVSYCQPQLEQVAQQVNWKPSEQPSPVLVATLVRDPQTPRNPDGYRVEIGGMKIGYTPRAEFGQQAGQVPVVLVKTGRDIIAWAAA
jgi:hypothetical protein